MQGFRSCRLVSWPQETKPGTQLHPADGTSASTFHLRWKNILPSFLHLVNNTERIFRVLAGRLCNRPYAGSTPCHSGRRSISGSGKRIARRSRMLPSTAISEASGANRGHECLSPVSQDLAGNKAVRPALHAYRSESPAGSSGLVRARHQPAAVIFHHHFQSVRRPMNHHGPK
jgi:hypothetical protein